MDDQQPGPSRQLMFALSPTKTFILPSVASGQQEDSQHNTGLSSLFRSIPSILQYQRIDTPHPLSPSQLQPVPTTTQQEQARPPSQSSQQSQPKSVDEPGFSHTNKGPYKGQPNLSKPIIQLLVLPKNNKAHHPTLTPPPKTYQQLYK